MKEKGHRITKVLPGSIAEELEIAVDDILLEINGKEVVDIFDYRYFMDENLFNHVNIDKSRTFVPNGLELDADKACNDYNHIIAQSGGIDMQLLGLGNNGHIGFNEPGSAFECETHCIHLTPSTIEANRRFLIVNKMFPAWHIPWGLKTLCRQGKSLLL